MRQRKSFYIVDKIEFPFKTLQEIKMYIESTLVPQHFLNVWVEKYNGKQELINYYYVEVSKNGKVSFK